MTTEIKEYKQLLTVELKDGTILNTDKTLDELDKFLQVSKDFIQIDGVIFNKYEFKKAYERKINWLEEFILSQPKDIQQKIRDRAKQMYDRVGKRFETIDQVQTFINNLPQWTNKTT